jgi:hypothetical protein
MLTAAAILGRNFKIIPGLNPFAADDFLTQPFQGYVHFGLSKRCGPISSLNAGLKDFNSVGVVRASKCFAFAGHHRKRASVLECGGLPPLFQITANNLFSLPKPVPKEKAFKPAAPLKTPALDATDPPVKRLITRHDDFR